MKTVFEVTLTGIALVYNDEQGKDYEEPVKVAITLNQPSLGWHVTNIDHAESGERLWP
jgi:hypothetical protein